LDAPPLRLVYRESSTVKEMRIPIGPADAVCSLDKCLADSTMPSIAALSNFSRGK
jgi:hypothetical protein